MILLQRTGRSEGMLRLDTDGARQLLAALYGLRSGIEAASAVAADVDGALLGKRGHKVLPCSIHLARQHAGTSDSSLSLEGDRVVWRFVEAEDEIEYAIKRLEDAVDKGYVAPAEFLMIQIPKSGHLIQLFGELSERIASEPQGAPK